ncbi:MAG TPA: S8 family serine peptidase, partial [Xanthobacteraceae bacterium]|nr:S8 family serine peptidase [Xanthobacteraceae bacterium]
MASLVNPSAGTFGGSITDASIGASGATPAQVQQALDESGLSVNGTGIKVGVLSDSFNDLGGAAADEADGALPSAANIQVLKDLPSGGSDEGRAMMQIVHDIAPGASLAFYTAFNSEQDFANGILQLAADGCKVICDDVSYFDEPFFQNGVVAQAIQTVEAEGVTYVTAAGNNASNAYQAAWTPISGTYQGTTLTDAESFGGSLVQAISINTEGTGYDVPLLLEWNQAYGAATSDLEMLVFNSSGQLVGTATNASSGEPTNPWLQFNFTSTGTYYVAIENLSGPNPGLIKEVTEGDGLPVTISGANVGTVYGHAMTPGAITAGAVSAADTPAFGVSTPLSESFSSSGAGTELLFANNGTALSSPDVLSPVAVSGVDDINTTVSDLSDFYGTSAASASLAGVAAVMLSANPNLTPAQVEQIMAETALPMANSAVSGAGLVQVDAAVALAEEGIKVAGTTSDALQGGASIPLLAAAPTITDPSSTTLARATVTIANGSGAAVSGDELSINGQQSGSVDGGAITVSWNGTTNVLTLTGVASLAVYQTLLGEVSYQDTGT